MNSLEIRATWSLASLFAVRMLGLFMILPVFAIYGNELAGATPALLGMAIGVYGLTQALLQIPFGLLSDRIGRKPVIVMGLVVFCFGSIIAALSESIHGVILGRALQGSGAIASAVMALVSDLTRDEHRAKAMAMLGASIGVSFSLALVIGPIIASMLYLQGLFWFTAFMAVGGVMLTVWVVPSPDQRRVYRDTRPVMSNVAGVLGNVDLLRLDLGIFLLHMILTASFVVLPSWLLNEAGLDGAHHWAVYLPVLFASFVAMIPFMIMAERAGKVKPVFVLAILLMAAALAGLSQWHHSMTEIVTWLFVFFWGFNLLEALLPSLVSKTAAPGMKGTSMGVYSTCQFLGAFVGGAGGGWLLGQFNGEVVMVVAAVAAVVWSLVSMGMKQPPNLHSVTLPLSQTGELDTGDWARRLMAIAGVEEAVVIAEDRMAYLKVDKKRLDREQLLQLSQPSV